MRHGLLRIQSREGELVADVHRRVLHAVLVLRKVSLQRGRGELRVDREHRRVRVALEYPASDVAADESGGARHGDAHTLRVREGVGHAAEHRVGSAFT